MNQKINTACDLDASKIDQRRTLETQRVLTYRDRMLAWPNPVEYVNNMYGNHPSDKTDYFKTVFGR